MQTLTKTKPGGRGGPGALAAEAAGLRWLAAAGGAAVVTVVADPAPPDDVLVLERVAQVRPGAAHAEAFGRDLHRTHAAGAPHVGAAPPGAPPQGWAASLRLPGVPGDDLDWPAFYAEHRLRPHLRAAADAGLLDAAAVHLVEAVLERLRAEGEALSGPLPAPARVHGDLWAGNVLWSADGAVLIDCSAHGGHPETDLAMLALFGLPHLERVLGAYAEAAGLDEGWRARVPLHQLHPLLVHTVLFDAPGGRGGQGGGGYAAQLVAAARACLAL